MSVDAITAGDIRLEILDTETVCFCRTTGATVVLDPFSAQIAAYLLDSGIAQSTQELAKHLSALAGCAAEALSVRVEASVRLLLAEHLVLRDT